MTALVRPLDIFSWVDHKEITKEMTRSVRRGFSDFEIVGAGSEDTISDGNITTQSGSSGKRAAYYFSLWAQEARDPF
jgi:hypothetical protein